MLDKAPFGYPECLNNSPMVNLPLATRNTFDLRHQQRYSVAEDAGPAMKPHSKSPWADGRWTIFKQRWPDNIGALTVVRILAAGSIMDNPRPEFLGNGQWFKSRPLNFTDWRFQVTEKRSHHKRVQYMEIERVIKSIVSNGKSWGWIGIHDISRRLHRFRAYLRAKRRNYFICSKADAR